MIKPAPKSLQRATFRHLIIVIVVVLILLGVAGGVFFYLSKTLLIESTVNLVGNFNSCPTVVEFQEAVKLPQEQVDSIGNNCSFDWFQGINPNNIVIRNFKCGSQWICEFGDIPIHGNISQPHVTVVDGDGKDIYHAYQATFYYRTIVSGQYSRYNIPVQCQIYNNFFTRYAPTTSTYVPTKDSPDCSDPEYTKDAY